MQNSTVAPPLLIDSFTKVYKSRRTAKTAVDSLSLEVPEGVVFGFLGPNGAGKTTTIKTVLDFIRPTAGKVSIFGLSSTDPASRKRVGYLPEQPYFQPFLKPPELLRLHASLAGVQPSDIGKRVGEALERTRLTDFADVPISKLSKGLAQRVGIAQAIISDPKLLILDEPTSGLDPIARRHVRDLLVELRSEGKTIFLSSHLLSEVEQVCDVIAVLKEGKLVFFGRPSEAKQPTARIVVTTAALSSADCDQLSRTGVCIEQSADTTRLTAEPDRIYALMRELEALRARIINLTTTEETMEEAFLRLAA